MRRQRRLDKDAVPFGIGIGRLQKLDELLFGGCRGKDLGLGGNAEHKQNVPAAAQPPE